MAKSRSGSNPAEDTRKADYIYLEAPAGQIAGQNDAAYSPLQRARELNSDDKDIGVELSLYLLRLSQTDSTLIEESMALLRDYNEANPSDLYYGGRYAMLNEQLLNRDEIPGLGERLHTYYPEHLEITYRYANALGRRLGRRPCKSNSRL